MISDQYQNYTVSQKEGSSVTGRIVDETDDKVVLQPNLLSSERVTVKKSDMTGRAPSKLSPMPEGLANLLTQDDILDLLAYIESAGKQRAGR